MFGRGRGGAGRRRDAGGAGRERGGVRAVPVTTCRRIGRPSASSASQTRRGFCPATIHGTHQSARGRCAPPRRSGMAPRVARDHSSDARYVTVSTSRRSTYTQDAHHRGIGRVHADWYDARVRRETAVWNDRAGPGGVNGESSKCVVVRRRYLVGGQFDLDVGPGYRHRHHGLAGSSRR